MNDFSKIAVFTHNPKGKWGDVRPIIENGYYKGWGKSINVELGQTVLIYISGDTRQIKYVMKVTRVSDKDIDMKLIKKLTDKESALLSFDKLKENGLKNGTINYILDNNKQLYGYIKNILHLNDTNKREVGSKMTMIKNIILYGSPGVGKTHNTNKLIRLIEDGKSDKEIFETIQTNTHSDHVDISDIKERVKFITFHQSFGYEDFIEGFRPNEEAGIELIDGVFKSISKSAQLNLENSKKDKKTLQEEMNLLEEFEQYVNEKIENQSPLKLKKGDEFYLDKYENNKLFFKTSEKSNRNKEFTLSYYDFEKIYKSSSKKETLADIKSILGTNSIQQKYAYYLQIYLDFIGSKKETNIINSNKINNTLKNFYLIIDEINRGNISKIFGELITLIEEDKRDTLEVPLPYSKKPFKIPSNLYIIGTMNSTDKSIALIDIALRRRFTFLKMEPKAELIKYQNARNIFETINEKIRETLGEDYQIGHSYFMSVESDEDLAFVLQYKIMPLLEEYYFGDNRGFEEIGKEVRNYMLPSEDGTE